MDDGEIVIRQFRHEDFETVKEIFVNGMIEDAKFYNTSMEEVQDYLNRQIDMNSSQTLYDAFISKGGDYWVAQERGSNCILGTVAMQKLNEEECELKRMSVLPIARRRGLGSKLLRHMEENAKKRNFKRIILDTLEEYEAAVKMYEKGGFHLLKKQVVKTDKWTINVVYYQKVIG
eukprot:TRINITY_DN1704_c0_g1_i2.p1 TRINITY_DN1704_c0_g1~~TRINITY_DN1704_c0_g1_i2.p1  ORF type:complete len:175 (-),score=36.28 TRINITY_DN1704_c0_g1_i2:231-755(-)